MTRNPFKQALNDHKPQLGLWLSLADSYTAEVCAASGFDWLLIDGEHGPNDVRTILHQLQAIAPYDVAPVVRPLNGALDTIKPLLDIGVRNLLVPMISTVDQAARLVAAVRYPPKGLRGIGHVLGRGSKWSRDRQYFRAWEDDALILIQLETGGALDNLEAILAVEGIDGALIGPADLSASLGYPGDISNPAVQLAIDNAIKRINHAGKPAGILAIGEDAAVDYFKKGCMFVAAGADVLLLAMSADALATGIKKKVLAP